MSHNRWLLPSTIFAGVLLPVGILGVIAARSAPFQAASQGAKEAAKPSINSDGSLFGEVIPAELEKPVTVKPSWLPLSKHLVALQDATQVPLTRAPSMPDDILFVTTPGRTEFSLLRQMRLLLTDDRWRAEWGSKEVSKGNDDVSKGEHSYHLWREAVSPQERKARMAKAAEDRLAKVLALLAAGPQAWDAARQDDPELSNGLGQSIRQAPLLLAAELSPEQIDAILMGQPLTLSVASMSPLDQGRVRQAVSAVPSNAITTTATSTITGEKRTVFDERHLLTTGAVVFEAAPAVGNPGLLELAMHIYTEPSHEFGMGSNGMLLLSASAFNPSEKREIEERHRQEAANALADKTPGSKMVTIDAAARPQPGEPELAAYLRAFAEQTKLTVLAHWPQDSKALTDDKGLPKRLPASIVNRPAGEALDILCKTYGGEWVQDEATVRLRALPAPEPVVRKPGSPSR